MLYVRACTRTRLTEKQGKGGTRFTCVGHRLVILYLVWSVARASKTVETKEGCKRETKRGYETNESTSVRQLFLYSYFIKL